MLNEKFEIEEQVGCPSPVTNDDEHNEKQLPMKCRQCRSILLVHPIDKVVDSHGVHIRLKRTEETAACKSDVWYVPEGQLPNWMKDAIDKGGWVKGKLLCPKDKCGSRLGSYNFVSGFKCQCGSQVVSPVHIVKSKVDFYEPIEVASSSIESTT